MSTLTAHSIRYQAWLLAAVLSVMAVGVSYGAVHSPFVVVGVVLGAAVLTVALAAPLALVAFMLMIGPIDLSFTTGGFKSLLPQMGGLDMNGIRLVGATAGFVAYIMFEPRSRAAAVGPLGRPWILLLAYAATTLALSMDRLEGMRFLLKLAYPFLTFLIVVGVADTRDRALKLADLTVISAVVYTLIINPLLVANGGYRIDLEGFTRVGGLGEGENPFAFYVLPMLMIAFARFAVRLDPKYLLFALSLLGWIGVTGTRIAALTAVVGIMLIGFLAARSSGNRNIMALAVLASVIAGCIFLPNVLARSFGFVPTPGELLRLFSEPMALYNSINWNGRQLLWAVLWGAFMASPIIGLGLGSSVAVIRETFQAGGIHSPHNDYIRMATDTGVLGLLLFVIAVGTWLVASLRFSRSEDRHVREFAFAAAATAISFMVVAITDNAIDFWRNFSQYLGLFIACAVVMHSTPRQGSAES